MKNTLFLCSVLIALCTLGCKNPKKPTGTIFDQRLADELRRMAEVDQVAAKNAQPPEAYKHLTQEKWETMKDSIYRSHKVRLEVLLDSCGYPGFDLVGKKGEKDYWLMVQHSDFDPVFQSRVLKELELQVNKGNADGRNFALLTDRVHLNTGKKQVYGTQVRYIRETGQAVPRILEDSLSVDLRRKSVGLQPIHEYLNDMTKLYFKMNKQNLLKRGVSKPNLYETE